MFLPSHMGGYSNYPEVTPALQALMAAPWPPQTPPPASEWVKEDCPSQIAPPYWWDEEEV
jgi:hypothetical protein